MSTQRLIVHVDMDAFFASVEQHDHPEWHGKPVIVGSGPHERGVVSTCSYEARKYGVHSAMPSRTAYQHCPHAIFVRPNMSRYHEVSSRVFEIFSRYTPFVEGVSVDEAFLDVTSSAHLFGGAVETAKRIRADIRQDCGITCSAGVATNRLLAKIASEMDKPDGLFVMPSDPQEITAFLAPKPIGILWGVGKKTAEILSKYAIRTCGDVQRIGFEPLASLLGDTYARTILNHSFGIDDSPVAYEDELEQSISREFTFAEDCSDREKVRSQLLALVGEVGEHVRRNRRWAKTARIKLRNSDFTTITRQKRFELPTRDDFAFRKTLLELFDEEWPKNSIRVIRLAGFGVTDFTENPGAEQMNLFDAPQDTSLRSKREKLSETLDALRKRFGDSVK